MAAALMLQPRRAWCVTIFFDSSKRFSRVTSGMLAVQGLQLFWNETSCTMRSISARDAEKVGILGHRSSPA